MFYNQKVDIPALLSDNNIAFKETGSRNVKVRCFSGIHEDKDPSLQINIETGEFHCFVCGIKGNIISYLINNNVIESHEAALYVKDVIRKENKDSKEVFKELKSYAKRRGLLKNHIKEERDITVVIPFKIAPAINNRYLTKRGFNYKDVEKWEMSEVISRGDQFYGWIYIPIYFKGKLRTYFLRNTRGKNKIYGYAKNKLTGLNEGYPRSDILYGYDNIKDFDKPCYLFEGMFDKIWFDKTRNNALALLGNSITQQQLPYLRNFKTIILGLDNDSASFNIAKTAAPLLSSGVDVKVWTPPKNKKDANDCSLRELIEQTYKEIDLYDFYKQPEFINWRLIRATAKSNINNN